VCIREQQCSKEQQQNIQQLSQQQQNIQQLSVTLAVRALQRSPWIKEQLFMLYLVTL